VADGNLDTNKQSKSDEAKTQSRVTTTNNGATSTDIEANAEVKNNNSSEVKKIEPNKAAQKAPKNTEASDKQGETIKDLNKQVNDAIDQTEIQKPSRNQQRSKSPRSDNQKSSSERTHKEKAQENKTKETSKSAEDKIQKASEHISAGKKEETPEPKATQEVRTEVVVKQQDSLPDVKPTKVKKNRVRPTNDPRKNAKPLGDIEIKAVTSSIQMTEPLDTSKSAAIARKPRNLKRPTNDPRSN